MAWEIHATLPEYPSTVNVNMDFTRYRYRIMVSNAPSYTVYVYAYHMTYGDEAVLYTNEKLTYKDITQSQLQSSIGFKNGDTVKFSKSASTQVYIQRESLNTAPTTPGAFTSPASGTVLKGGQTVNLAWGASSDVEGNAISYEVDYSLNGGSYKHYYKLNGTTYNFPLQHTVMPSDKNITFRVRARDSNSAFSGYQYSPTFTISHNVIPTLILNTAEDTPITSNQTLTIPLQTDYAFHVTASDVDTGQTLQYKVSVAGVEVVPLTSIAKDTPTLVSVDKSKFVVGMNAVVVTVQDDQGAETTFQFNIIVDANIPIDSSCLANMRFNGYSLSTISLAELVNHLE